jgi:hypothetical protein
MSIDEIRARVAAAYPGQAWKDRVIAMHRDQILAIWFRMQQAGEDEPPKPEPKNDNQGTLF